MEKRSCSSLIVPLIKSYLPRNLLLVFLRNIVFLWRCLLTLVALASKLEVFVCCSFVRSMRRCFVIGRICQSWSFDIPSYTTPSRHISHSLILCLLYYSMHVLLRLLVFLLVLMMIQPPQLYVLYNISCSKISDQAYSGEQYAISVIHTEQHHHPHKLITLNRNTNNPSIPSNKVSHLHLHPTAILYLVVLLLDLSTQFQLRQISRQGALSLGNRFSDSIGSLLSSGCCRMSIGISSARVQE